MVNEEKVSIVYNGNGKTKEFNYPYSFTEGAEIVGYLNNGKTVTKINSNFEFNASTKKYTYPTSGNPIPAGQSLLLIRRTQRSNLVDLPNDTPFAAIERQFDKVVRILQELGDTEGMGKTMTVLSNQFNAVIPKGKPYAYIRFNKDVTAFEVVDNPFEVGENQLQQIREVQKTIEVLQGAMNNGINHLNQIKQDFDIGVVKLNDMTDSLTAQFSNTLNSKLEESTATLELQKEELLAGMRDVVKSGVNSINLNMQELERIKKSVIDDNLVEIRQLKDEAVERAVEARASANEAAKSAAASLVSEGNANNSELNAKASQTASANSEVKAASSAKEANTSAIDAKESAASASVSATTAIKQATLAKSSAVEAKRQADRATAIAGGDLATRSEVKEQVSTALSTANKNLQSHIDNATAHLELFDKVASTARSQLDSHDRAVDAHIQLFKDVQVSINTSYAMLNTDLRQHIDDSVTSLTQDITVGLNTKADKTTVEALSVKVDTKANETIVAEIDKKLETKMPINGGTFTSNPIIKSGNFSAVILENTSGNKLILEGKPDDRDIIASLFLYDTIEQKGKYYFNFPKQGGTVATLDDVLLKTGGTITGNLTISTGNFSSIQLVNPQGYKLFLENAPNDRDRLGSLISQSDKGVNVYQLNIPKESGVIATQDYVQQVAVKNRRCVTNTGTSGSTWWREWSDGWLEMGGTVDVMKEKYTRISAVTYHNTTVTYPKAFRSVPTTTFSLRSNFSDIRLPHFYEYDKTKFSVDTSNIGTQADYYVGVTWRAQGWKA